MCHPHFKTGLTGLLSFWTLTPICYCKEHSISETGSVSDISDYPALSKRPNSRCLPPFHLGIKMGPVSETLCSLEYWMMVKVQKHSNHQDPLKLRRTACYPGIRNL
jgi:hypothetical protein